MIKTEEKSWNQHQITKLLKNWKYASEAEREQLINLVYDELKKIAHAHLRRERKSPTLQTTALVNEVYMRIFDQQDMSWENRAHFFGIAARVCRQVLTAYLRQQSAKKRGGGEALLQLEAAENTPEDRPLDLIKLDDALTDLEAMDLRKSQVVELRFFAGLSIEETARALELSPASVKREWSLAKAYLYRHIVANGNAEDP